MNYTSKALKRWVETRPALTAANATASPRRATREAFFKEVRRGLLHGAEEWNAGAAEIDAPVLTVEGSGDTIFLALGDSVTAQLWLRASSVTFRVSPETPGHPTAWPFHFSEGRGELIMPALPKHFNSWVQFSPWTLAEYVLHFLAGIQTERVAR